MPLAARRSVARPVPPKSWLQCRADEWPIYLEPENPDVPAEYRELERRQWETARRSLETGDELWYFDNGPEKWKALCGRAGYAVVRDGVIVEAVLVRMN